MSRRYEGRRYASGLGPSRVRTRIPTTRQLGQWVSLRKLLCFRVRLQLSQSRCLSLLYYVLVLTRHVLPRSFIGYFLFFFNLSPLFCLLFARKPCTTNAVMQQCRGSWGCLPYRTFICFIRIPVFPNLSCVGPGTGKEWPFPNVTASFTPHPSMLLFIGAKLEMGFWEQRQIYDTNV